ncbi:MAG: DMT family transporter [Thaumarchaeota archaeon]|nr:DMT family transporter [Nitrososphaerota archaeon]
MGGGGKIQTSNATILRWFLPYVLIASLQYEFAKDGLNYASPFLLMAGRYLVVGTIFYFLGGRKIPLDRDALKVALYASISTLFWAVGLQYVSPGDSAVLSYTMPLFSIPIAYFSINEKVSLREVFGAIIGFSGVIIYSITLSHGSLLIGAIFTIINAVFWAAYSVYYRKLRNRELAPIFTTQFLLGSIPFVIGSLFFPRVVPTINFFVDFAYIIFVMGLVQYFLWNKLLRLGRVGKITTMAFAVPATSIFINAVLTFTAPSWLSVLGAGIMFTGIFVASWQRERKSQPDLLPSQEQTSK